MNGNQAFNPLHIFLSHKLIDTESAGKIVSSLRTKGGRGARVYFPGEKKQMGKRYQKWIQKSLETAEWYILAYTEPVADWHWCLYEAGYFEAAKNRIENSQHRIICIHRGNERPSPISRYDSVSVDDSNGLGEFSMSYIERVNPELPAADKIAASEDLSNSVREAFSDRPENRYSGSSISFRVPNPEQLGATDLPDDATVTGSAEIMSSVFKIESQSVSWSEVRDKFAATKDPRWVTQLTQALKTVHSTGTPKPITGHLRVLQEDHNFSRSYLPVLDRVDELRADNYECRVILAEGLTSFWGRGMSARVHALLAGMRMTVRFRYDFLEVYTGNLRFIIENQGIKRFRETFRDLMYDIVTESEVHGLTSPELMVDCFDSEEDKNEIREIYAKWGDEVFPCICDATGMSPDKETWTEFDDSEISDDQVQLLDMALKELRPMNTRFLILTMQRYQELIQSDEA